MYDFPVLYGIKKQNGNANGRLCKERLFRSTIFAVISPALISFSGAPNGLNALPEVRFEFFFNLTNHSLPRSRFSDVTQRSCDIQKTAAGETRLWGELKFCTLVYKFCTQNKDFG